MNKTSFGKGLQDGIPIGLGYFAVSFTFGIMAIQSGLTSWQAVLFYSDYFRRPTKRGGAWMSAFAKQSKQRGQLPIIYNV